MIAKRRKPLRHLITVWVPTDTVNAKRDLVTTYEEENSFQVYGSIEPLQGRELVVAKGMRGDLSHSITMRFNRNINHKCKLTWNDGVTTREFYIGPEVNTENRNVEMSFYAVEVK